MQLAPHVRSTPHCIQEPSGWARRDARNACNNSKPIAHAPANRTELKRALKPYSNATLSLPSIHQQIQQTSPNTHPTPTQKPTKHHHKLCQP